MTPARGKAFTSRLEVATLDPFHGYKNAIDDEMQDATAVLDAFHVSKLGTQVVDEVRRRVQQDTLGHRGRKGDPLYGIRTVLRAGVERLTDRRGPASSEPSTPDPSTTPSSSPGPSRRSSAWPSATPRRPRAGRSPSS